MLNTRNKRAKRKQRLANRLARARIAAEYAEHMRETWRRIREQPQITVPGCYAVITFKKVEAAFIPLDDWRRTMNAKRRHRRRWKARKCKRTRLLRLESQFKAQVFPKMLEQMRRQFRVEMLMPLDRAARDFRDSINELEKRHVAFVRQGGFR
jgi:transposase-like protein